MKYSNSIFQNCQGRTVLRLSQRWVLYGCSLECTWVNLPNWCEEECDQPNSVVLFVHIPQIVWKTSWHCIREKATTTKVHSHENNNGDHGSKVTCVLLSPYIWSFARPGGTEPIAVSLRRCERTLCVHLHGISWPSIHQDPSKCFSGPMWCGMWYVGKLHTCVKKT